MRTLGRGLAGHIWPYVSGTWAGLARNRSRSWVIRGRVPAEAYTATHPGHVAALALLDAIPLNWAVTVAGLNRRNEIATDLQRMGLIPNPLPPVRHNSCLALVKALNENHAVAVSHHDATLNSGNIEHRISGRNSSAFRPGRRQVGRVLRAWCAVTARGCWPVVAAVPSSAMAVQIPLANAVPRPYAGMASA